MLLSAEIGDEVSHGAVHSWVKEERSGSEAGGRPEGACHVRGWRGVFEGEGEEKEIVAYVNVGSAFFVEVDGT